MVQSFAFLDLGRGTFPAAVAVLPYSFSTYVPTGLPSLAHTESLTDLSTRSPPNTLLNTVPSA